MSSIDSYKLYNNNSRFGNKLFKGDLKVSKKITRAIKEIIPAKA